MEKSVENLNEIQTLSYEKVLDKIENSRRFGNLYGYDITKIVLEKLGHPEKTFKFVQIAGTNGKGSTASAITKIMEQTGEKIGLFTSPHLIDFEERIRIGDEQISKEEVKRLGNVLLSIDFGVNLTMFDYCLAMAVLYFKEKNVKFAVIETGLGGDHDSTTALGTPEVAVLTKIGFDHMQILGNTLKEIATSKCGIIKANSKVVSQIQEPEAKEVIESTVNNPVNEVKKYRKVTIEEKEKIRHLKRKLLGEYQLENLATAAVTCQELLSDLGYETNEIEKFIEKGVQQTTWPGRMQILNETPFLMVDGAHNGHGVRALRDSLVSLYPGEKFHFIMGVLADKDYEKMVDILIPLAVDFTTFTPESTRALQGENLRKYISSHGCIARSCEDIEKEINKLLTSNTNEDKTQKTIAFGSLYFIGEIEKIMKKH